MARNAVSSGRERGAFKGEKRALKRGKRGFDEEKRGFGDLTLADHDRVVRDNGEKLGVTVHSACSRGARETCSRTRYPVCVCVCV
eukprot:1738569-Rhodomonas_salina.1